MDLLKLYDDILDSNHVPAVGEAAVSRSKMQLYVAPPSLSLCVFLLLRFLLIFGLLFFA